MRALPMLFLAAIGAGCSAANPSDDASDATLASATVNGDGRHAVLSPFVPPTPAGCGAATAYDFCFAFDRATPLEVDAQLPAMTRANAVAIVRFHAIDAASKALVVQHVEFRVGERSDLRLYFQVYPGSYRITVGVDLDGDGNPEGAGDALGSTAIVDVGGAPIATSFTLALQH